MTNFKGKKPLRSPVEREEISRDEILDVMADDGYSAGDRRAWLKEVLTHVSRGQKRNPDPERDKLAGEIREILHRHVSDDPEADNTT